MTLPRRRSARPCMLSPAVVWVVASLTACTAGAGPGVPGAPGDPFFYVSPPATGSFPTTEERINGWIDSFQIDSIRMHGWDMWASITTPSGIDSLPVWETWYSGHELFEMPAVPASERPHRHFREFEIPRQFAHGFGVGSQIPLDLAERRLAFNRYTLSTASFIWDNQLNLAQTLADTNAWFDASNTPLAERQVLVSSDSVDTGSVVLKPVFQFISGDSASVVPYWAGVSPQTATSMTNPSAITWRQGVVVDPTGTLQPGTYVDMPVNQEPSAPRLVVSLEDFYYLRITVEDSANYSQFAAESGDNIGAGDSTTVDSVLAMVRPGNVALLMAMHVTGKEIPNWTWQTFWWAYDPDDPRFGADRRSDIPAPWNHYNMDVAYFMAVPPNGPGEPYVVFNPYLETNLNGTIDGFAHISPTDSVDWYGIQSNCMSCHRMAAAGQKTLVGGDSALEGGAYWPNGYIDLGDSLKFAGLTKTDFLWSLQVRAKFGGQ